MISAILVATLLNCAGAFTFRSVPPKQARPYATTACFTSSLPHDSTRMPFYALGVNLAVQTNQAGVNDLKSLLEQDELEIFLQAFCNQLRGNTAPEEARAILTNYGPQINIILQNRTRDVSDRIKKEGEDFVTDFLTSYPEATKTGSGLVYYEATAGTGAKPTLHSTVEVRYVCSLTDGTVIDSTLDGGEPMSYALSEATRGFQEGLQLMKEGGKATLVIPSDLAYGDRGMGNVIQPGAAIKFEIELLKVSTPETSETVEMEDLELPDGRTVRVPKGVKMRVVKDDDE